MREASGRLKSGLWKARKASLKLLGWPGLGSSRLGPLSLTGTLIPGEVERHTPPLPLRLHHGQSEDLKGPRGGEWRTMADNSLSGCAVFVCMHDKLSCNQGC